MVKNILIVLFLFLIPRIEAQKIFSVKYDNRADLKVFVVKYESRADLLVYKVKYESRVGENQGKWFFVDYESWQVGKINPKNTYCINVNPQNSR